MKPSTPSFRVGQCRTCRADTCGVPDWQNQIVCTECRHTEHGNWWPDHTELDDPYKREEM